MIAAPASISVAEFEEILENTVKTLRITLATAPTMSNDDFEASVKKAMDVAAKGTPIDGRIERTRPGEFPDIVADKYYGVEVKQIQKDYTRTRGNSIFESTRTKGVGIVYLVMSWNNASGASKVDWKRYEDAIAGVVITHSPRYLLDIALEDGNTIFDQIEMSYDEFREMDQPDMMAKVRELYRGVPGSDNESLWWLDTVVEDRPPMRHFESLGDSNPDRLRLIGEAFFLCPIVFGEDHRRKYAAPLAYWLSRGFAAQVIRDKFTSGGKGKIDGVEVPQIIKRAERHKQEIETAADGLEENLIKQFWDVDKVPADQESRIKAWIKQVRLHYEGPLKDMRILEDVFLG